MTPAELSQEIREAFAYAARYLALLTGNNPGGSAAQLLERPDVKAVLEQCLDISRDAARQAVTDGWDGPQEDQYRSWLLGDVDAAYSSLSILNAAVRVAWHSEPAAAFAPGVTPPGDSPAMEAARRRADAVSRAVLAHGSGLALRSRLSAEVSVTASRTARELARGEELEARGHRAWKQWKCRCTGRTGIPDARVCHWCRALHGMVIPLAASFPPGSPEDLTGHGRLTHPPRVYHGVLKGPPRHPRCRCKLVILTRLPRTPVDSASSDGQGARAVPTPGRGTGAGASPRSRPRNFLAAADIRAMDSTRYHALLTFLRAAAHELGQLLGKLRQARRG